MFKMRLCLTFLLLCLVIPGRLQQEEDEYLRFPEGFAVGSGGSSYQIEGGWNASDKGENVWDRFVHTRPEKIEDGSNGDIACDSYHKYKEDVQWVKEIELDHYRFSISWSRILPNGFANLISQDGLRYYHNLVDELLANDIEPIITLYHWDHPQILEDLGGWTNESMVEWFTDYADIIFREFAPKVKVFTTINESKMFCFNGYVNGVYAPGKTLNASAAFLCGHNALKAHARAYHLYDQEYRTQNGKISIGSACASHLPKNPNETLAAEIAFQFSCGWIAHPIFIGDYPQIVKTKLAEYSRNVGLPESILPEFTPEWIEYINGTSDYFGLNHYQTFLIELGPRKDIPATIDLFLDIGISSSYDPNWEGDSAEWTLVTPQGFGYLLRKIKEEYNNPPLYVLENGTPTDNGVLNDYKRIKYYHLYLKELLLAVHRDGCNVQKYTFWSLFDNFEWNSGYKIDFGLVHVNFSSPNRERVLKLSATWLKNVMHTRKLQPPILPDSTNSTVHP